MGADIAPNINKKGKINKRDYYWKENDSNLFCELKLTEINGRIAILKQVCIISIYVKCF